MNAATILKNHFNLRARETNHGMVCYYDEGTCSWWAITEEDATSCENYPNTEEGYFDWCKNTSACEIKDKNIDLYIESMGAYGSIEQGIVIAPVS